MSATPSSLVQPDILPSAFARVHGIVAYLVFLASTLYAAGLVGNLFLPATIDSGQLGPPIPAIGIDLAGLTLFAVQHGASPTRDAAIIQNSTVGEPR